MCGINGLPIAEPRDEDFAEALLALSGVPEEPVEDVETTHPVDPSQQADDRFYCPFPGCRRSFAELWRLKVHYRAPPNVRGSGKERGHGMRLDRCPKCNAVLKIGGHHVRCSAREAARQLAKKPRRTGPASASEPKAASQKQQKQQQQQQADDAGSDSFPDSGYTATTTPGTHLQTSLPYAHVEQQHQQQASSYGFWEHQQQLQQQLEEQPRLQVPVLPEVQQLRRLQQLLDRVDQHLGFDFDPAEAAAAAAAPAFDHTAVAAAAAAAPAFDHTAVAGYGEAAGYGGAAAAAAADTGYQASAHHQQLLASLTGAAAGGYGAAAADEGSSLPPYPLTVQQQLYGDAGYHAAQFVAAQDCSAQQQHAASSDSSTSSGGGGGGSNSGGGGSSSSLDASRVSSVAADMHYEYTASAQQQHDQQQAQSQLLQIFQQHAGAHSAVFGLDAAKQSALLQHAAEPHTSLQAAAAAAGVPPPSAAAAACEYPGAVQALLQQALQAMAASHTPQVPTQVPEPPPLQAAAPPAAGAAVHAPPVNSAEEEDPAAAAAAAVAAAAVAAVQAALLQRPAQDESHLLALLRETLA